MPTLALVSVHATHAPVARRTRSSRRGSGSMRCRTIRRWSSRSSARTSCSARSTATTWRDGALCGLLLGFLVLLKPANGPLPLVGGDRARRHVPVPRRARLRSSRWLPAVARAHGLEARPESDQVPLLTADHRRRQWRRDEAPAGRGQHHRYLNIDCHHLSQNVHALGQVFWSVRLLEFLLLAGAIGLDRHAPAGKGLLIVAWFVGVRADQGNRELLERLRHVAVPLPASRRGRPGCCSWPASSSAGHRTGPPRSATRGRQSRGAVGAPTACEGS